MSHEIDYDKQLNDFNPSENFLLAHRKLQIKLLKQLLKLHNLSFEWFDIILDIAWKAVDLVKPDVKHDNDQMDIRSYLKIKKLPGKIFLFLFLFLNFIIMVDLKVVQNVSARSLTDLYLLRI